MTEPRRLEPLPLGAHGGPRYSKGLMARALMATGLAPEPAYALARRLEGEAAARNGKGITLDRVEEVATELLGDTGRDAALLSDTRPLPVVPKEDEVLARVLIVTTRQSPLFADEVFLLLRPGPAGYKIGEIYEDFRLP